MSFYVAVRCLLEQWRGFGMETKVKVEMMRWNLWLECSEPKIE